MHEIEGCLTHVEKEIEGEIQAEYHLFAIDQEIGCNHGCIGNKVDNPGPHALLFEILLHPDIVRGCLVLIRFITVSIALYDVGILFSELVEGCFLLVLVNARSHNELDQVGDRNNDHQINVASSRSLSVEIGAERIEPVHADDGHHDEHKIEGKPCQVVLGVKNEVLDCLHHVALI